MKVLSFCVELWYYFQLRRGWGWKKNIHKLIFVISSESAFAKKCDKFKMSLGSPDFAIFGSVQSDQELQFQNPDKRSLNVCLQNFWMIVNVVSSEILRNSQHQIHLGHGEKISKLNHFPSWTLKFQNVSFSESSRL